MNIHEIKIKGEEYKNGNLYVLNNIDSDSINEHSEFLLGSISKLFTAFVFLMLNEKNIISIDEDVGVFLKNDNFKGIKIIELLNHVSGLKRVPDNIENFMSQNEYTKASEVYETFKDSYLKIYEKETFNYSNIGYIILGTILEKKMNKSYFKVIEEYILKPLNMTNTNINNNNIRLYGPELEKYDFIQSDRNYASSAGAFHGSVSDFIKFQNV